VVRGAVGRVSRRKQRLHVNVSNLQHFAVFEQLVKLAAVRFQKLQIVNGLERFLNALNVLANCNLHTRKRLAKRMRSRNVILFFVFFFFFLIKKNKENQHHCYRMDVSFQDPLELELVVLEKRNHLVQILVRKPARIKVEVQNGSTTIAFFVRAHQMIH
jgi:hypothetical protein